MAYKNIADRAYSTLPAELLSTETTSFSVQTGEGDRFPASDFVVTLELKDDQTTYEHILISSRTGDTFTIEARGYGTTSATTFPMDSLVELRVRAEDITDLQENKVEGPASATDNAIARFDGTGGKTIQNSSVTIDDDGNVGIGVAASSSYRLRALTSHTSGTHWATYGGLTATITDSLASYSLGGQIRVDKIVAGTKADTGYMQGLNIAVRRNALAADSNDSGSLNTIYGGSINFGHSNANTSATPTTSNVYGLRLRPYERTGTITNRYSIHLAAPTTGGTVTNKWAIYSEDDAPVYFAGNLTTAGTLSCGAITSTAEGTLARKASDETISGNWRFNGNISQSVAPSDNSPVYLSKNIVGGDGLQNFFHMSNKLITSANTFDSIGRGIQGAYIAPRVDQEATNFNGAYIFPQHNVVGAVTNIRGILVYPGYGYRDEAGSSVTNAMGILIKDWGNRVPATLTNQYGLYIENQTRATNTNKWGIYSAHTGAHYLAGDLTAKSYADNTPGYEGDALADIKKIKSKNGEIDHSTLPTFAQAKIKKPIYEEKKDKSGKVILDEEGTSETEYKRTEETTGRDIGAMVSILTKAVQQLTAEIEELKKGK